MPELRHVHIPYAVLKIKYQVKSAHYWLKVLCVNDNLWFQEIEIKIVQAYQLTTGVQFN